MSWNAGDWSEVMLLLNLYFEQMDLQASACGRVIGRCRGCSRRCFLPCPSVFSKY